MVSLQRLTKVPNPTWYTISLFLLILSICGIIIISVIYYFANQLIYSYGIIVDAGSTSTKIYLYKWPEIASRTNGEVTEVNTCKTNPGISDFMNDPEEASSGIQFCIETEITPHIPRRLRKKTFLYLGATAGMRLIEKQNPKAMKLIFEAVEGYLLSTGYRMGRFLSDVKVISGNVEGIAAWISVNYLKEALQTSVVSNIVKKRSNKTYGALDLGGASTQITFVPDRPPKKLGISPIRLYGIDYNVYSHSYLCYGKSQAELRFLGILSQKWLEEYNNNRFTKTIINPCMQKGDNEVLFLQDIITIPCIAGQYAKDNFGFSVELPESLKDKTFNITFVGSGDPEECLVYVRKLFNVTTCSHSNCGFNNIYQPKLNDEFLAFAGYYVMYKLLQNYSDIPLSYDEFLARSKSHCQQIAPVLDAQVSPKEKEIDNYRKWRCFGYLYVFQLLTSLGFNSENWQSITFTNAINDATLAWSLGYMINKTSMIPIEKPIFNLGFDAFIGILILCLVILSIGCLFAILSYKLRRSKGQYAKPSEQKDLKSNLYDNADEELASKV